MTVFLELIGIDLGLPRTIPVVMAFLLSLVVFLTFLLITGLSYLQIPKLLGSVVEHSSSSELKEVYQQVIQPDQGWLSWVTILSLFDFVLLTTPTPTWLAFWELPLAVLVSLNVTLLSFKLFTRFFDSYLLEVVLEDQSKINSELLALAKFLAKAFIVLIIIFLFAQSHQINLVGLVASLGVGGVAIAFASQKVIEQILWSIVLYIDRPFTVDDYIHLPDRNLGRVESVGWRSTKIRLSGKNTLVVVPNSNLAQMSIENLSRAKRIVSIVTLTFFRVMSEEEKALIHNLILESTNDILGIDHQLTQVTFQNLTDQKGQDCVQAQVIFFILGTTETTLELQQGLLAIARDKMIERLEDYGIKFKFKETVVDVTQPMNM